MSNRNEYIEAKKKINERIEKLNIENQEDEKKLVELEARYEEAVANLDDNSADGLHDEMFTIRKDISNRKSKVKILQRSDNPVLKAAATNLLKRYAEEAGTMKSESETKIQDVLKKKEEYLAAVAELKTFNAEYSDLRVKMEGIVNQADQSDLPAMVHPKIGVMGGRDLVNLSEFAVEKHHIFS